MSFTRIGDIPSVSTEDEKVIAREWPLCSFLRREGRDEMVRVRSGSTGRRGHEVMGEPVMGEYKV